MEIFPPFISKTYLPIHLMSVKSNSIDVQKTSQGKWESPVRGEWKLNFPAKSKGMRLPNAVQSK